MSTISSAVAVQLWRPTVLELQPKYEKQSIGAAERAVRTIKGQVRKMASALYTRMGVMTWLTPYAAVVVNRRMVGSDGKTSQERIKGRRSLRSMCEFGQCLTDEVRNLLLLLPRNHHVVCDQENANKRTMELEFASLISVTPWPPRMQPGPQEQPPDIDQGPGATPSSFCSLLCFVFLSQSRFRRSSFVFSLFRY